MHKIIAILGSIVSVIVAIFLLYIVYRLGYCAACDKYIGANECKPRRQWGLFDD